jgi:DNA polymerase III epsilon subunit family exonuclease
LKYDLGVGIQLSQSTFVIVDLETTGPSPKSGSAITEIGAVKVKGGLLQGEFESFVNPLLPIPQYITELTGITDLMLANAPIIDDALPLFLEFTGDHQEIILVAHNAPFDLSFLKSAAEAIDLPWPDYKVLDTVTIARQVLSLDEVANCKLSTLAQFFGSNVDPNHRALDDAKATTEVLHGLLGRLGSMNINTEDKLFDFAKNAKRIQSKKFYGQPSI